MRVLGIDPGTAITGYGVVESVNDELHLITYGAITTPAKHPLPERLQMIHQELSVVIAEYEPDEAAVEELFFSKNARTALSVGQARGVVILTLANADISIGEYTPLQIKQAIVGYGKATKHQVQDMVRMLLQLEEIPRPDDAADGVAVAVCHLHSYRLNSLLNQ